jgi:ankyrin repeat protein
LYVQDFEGYSPLHWAVESSAISVVQLLLGAGADVFVRTTEGLTPQDFVETLKPKNKPAIRELLSKAADQIMAQRATAGGSTSA